MSETIEAVFGVIVRDGRILLSQRRADQSYPMRWELAGGKVEGNESHHDALRRELREELGINVKGISQKSLFCGTFPRSSGKNGEVFLLMYYVFPDWEGSDWKIQGKVSPREGQGWGWFSGDDLYRLDLAPGAQKARETLVGAVVGASSWNQTWVDFEQRHYGCKVESDRRSP